MATSNAKSKRANGVLCNLKPLPKEDISSSSTSSESEESEDSEDGEESSAEEEIITEGARLQLSSSPLDRLSTNRVIKAPREREDSPTEDDEPTTDDEEEGSDVETEPEREPEVSKPVRQVGFPSPEELPSWFPENIKQIYRIDRRGGALRYSELNEITRYRSALEDIRRRKWRKYIEAGEARWKLQQLLHRLRVKSWTMTKRYHEYRKKQFETWKKKALRSWKRLEKTHLGILILDETINLNFRQERMIYEKKLGGGCELEVGNGLRLSLFV